jgi:hypothetical protein
MAWKAESVGLAFFSPVGGIPDALSPFMQAVGLPPQTMAPVEGVPPGQRVASQFGPGTIAMIARPGRLDLVAEPGGDNEPPGLDEPIEVAKSLLTFADRLLDARPANRLALNMNLVRFVATMEDAVQHYGVATGIPDIPRNATDLLYQQNIPTVHGGRALNRLTRWGTGLIQLLQFQINSGMPLAAGAQPQISRQWHTVSLTLDYNTAPVPESFPAEEAKALLRTLIGQAEEKLSQEDRQFNADLN